MAEKWSILKRGTGREFLSAIFDRQKERGGAVLLASKNGASKKGPFYIYHVILGREKKKLTHSLVVPRTSLDRSKIVYHLRVCFFGSYRGDVDRARRFFFPTLHFFSGKFP